jgi:SAM-dependent methyltransferase
VGCGTGRLGRALSKHVSSYLGIDLDNSAIRAAQALQHPAHVKFTMGDATKLPVGQFDVAMLVHVLEHLDEPEELLRNLCSVAPKLIVEVPDFNRCVLNRVRADLGMDFFSDEGHVREYTEPLLREHLEAGGWRPVQWTRSSISFAAVAVKG